MVLGLSHRPAQADRTRRVPIRPKAVSGYFARELVLRATQFMAEPIALFLPAYYILVQFQIGALGKPWTKG